MYKYELQLTHVISNTVISNCPFVSGNVVRQTSFFTFHLLYFNTTGISVSVKVYFLGHEKYFDISQVW